MTAAARLAELDAHGVLLSVIEGRLLVKARAGSLGEADRRAIRQHRDELLLAIRQESDREAIEERAAILEFEAGLSRAEAERRAGCFA